MISYTCARSKRYASESAVQAGLGPPGGWLGQGLDGDRSPYGGTTSPGLPRLSPLWLPAAAWIVSTSTIFSTLYTPDKPRSPIPQEDAGLTAQRKHTEEPRERAVKMVSEMRDRVEKGLAGSLKKVVS